jgi:hypothetical protein
MGIRPASQVEVRLIDDVAQQEIAGYVAEYETLKQDLLQENSKQLSERLGEAETADDAEATEDAVAAESPGEEIELTIENLINGSAPLSEEQLKAEHPEVQRIVEDLNRTLEPLTDEERTQVTERVQRYLDFALYCRNQMEEVNVGADFFELGAQYWEDRATRLKEMGRLLVDDAEPSYETSWLPYAGLGEEPSQKVLTVVRADKRAQLGAIERAKSEAAGSAKKQAREKGRAATARRQVDEGGVIAGAPVTTNEILDLVTRVQQRLRQQYVDMLKRSDEKLLALTVEQVTTDEDGRFIFSGDVIQPGDFLLFARYDMLTTDGEQVEFMWFQPVAISLRRFAFDKSTVVALDELNQHRPACLEVAEPTRETLFDEMVAVLKAEQQRR